MKTRELLREFSKEAKTRGLAFELVRSTGPHDVYRCDSVTVAVPRHGEIGPKMEFKLRTELEPVFGKRWWR